MANSNHLKNLVSEIQRLTLLHLTLQTINKKLGSKSPIKLLCEASTLSLEQNITNSELYQLTTNRGLLDSSLRILIEYNRIFSLFLDKIQSLELGNDLRNMIYLIKPNKFLYNYIVRLESLNKDLMILYNCANMLGDTKGSNILSSNEPTSFFTFSKVPEESSQEFEISFEMVTHPEMDIKEALIILTPKNNNLIENPLKNHSNIVACPFDTRVRLTPLISSNRPLIQSQTISPVTKSHSDTTFNKPSKLSHKANFSISSIVEFTKGLGNGAKEACIDPKPKLNQKAKLPLPSLRNDQPIDSNQEVRLLEEIQFTLQDDITFTNSTEDEEIFITQPSLDNKRVSTTNPLQNKITREVLALHQSRPLPSVPA